MRMLGLGIGSWDEVRITKVRDSWVQKVIKHILSCASGFLQSFDVIPF